MKVVRVVGYHQDLKLDEAPEPKITSPLDVIVKIGAAGVCRTDLHILEGQWEEKAGVKLPCKFFKSNPTFRRIPRIPLISHNKVNLIQHVTPPS